MKVKLQDYISDLEKKVRKNKENGLEGNEKKVFESLEVVPLQINDIAERSNIDCGTLSAILINLELKGMVEEVGKNLYIKKK